MERIEVKQSTTHVVDAKDAVLDIRSKLEPAKDSFNLLFCSSNYDLNLLGSAIQDNFGHNVIACTTSGEISHKGISNNGISAATIKSDLIKFHKIHIDNLQTFNINNALSIADDFKQKADLANKSISNFIGMLLIDGLSMLEDKVIALLSKAFAPIEIVGGSAGDDMVFSSTWIYNNGKFTKNTATLLIIESEIPFMAFKSQHFEPTSDKLVITEADPSKRIVYEINGEKAAIEYSEILGISTNELNPQVFAKNPVMLNIGGNWYIRSIAKMNPDFSLTFFCAIDNGLVLTIAKGNDIINNYKEQFERIKQELGEVSLIIAFDCILRRYEIEQKNLQEDLNLVLAGQNIIGFNTYGEQCNSVHVNQTLTGIAFGK